MNVPGFLHNLIETEEHQRDKRFSERTKKATGIAKRNLIKQRTMKKVLGIVKLSSKKLLRVANTGEVSPPKQLEFKPTMDAE